MNIQNANAEKEEGAQDADKPPRSKSKGQPQKAGGLRGKKNSHAPSPNRDLDIKK